MAENDIRRVTLFDKQGTPQFEAYVHTCVTSASRSRMVDGSWRHELYYLSMYGPRGSATTLQSIFAALVTNSTIRDVEIEGIGRVALMHRSTRINSMGYTTSWSCAFQDFGPDRALNAIVESPGLCYWDPEEAALTVKRRSSSGQKGKHSDEQKATSAAKRTVGVQTSTPADLPDDVAEKFERRPIFLLMVPALYQVPDDAESCLKVEAEAARLSWMQQLYLAYIDKRCPFPLLDDLAPFLWSRALQQTSKEMEKLSVWSYRGELVVPPDAERDLDVEGDEQGILPIDGDTEEVEDAAQSEPPDQGEVVPFLTDAYLCFPDLVGLMKAVCTQVAEMQEILDPLIANISSFPVSQPPAPLDDDARAA